MDSVPPSYTQLEHPAVAEGAAAWRALPRLLVGRRWRWITLGAVLIALVLARFGFWQLDRLAQRRAHNQQITAGLAAPPLDLTANATASPTEYQVVTIRGTYDYANEVVLRNRSREGVPGVDILTPMHIAGGDRTVLVDRGWVPLLQYDRAALAQWATPGEVSLTGIVRSSQVATSSWGPQDTAPASGPLQTWFRADVGRIGAQLPYPVLPFWVQARLDPSAPDLPHPQPNIQLTEGSHLSYALQWFSFAIIGLCGYAALVVKQEQARANAKAIDTPAA